MNIRLKPENEDAAEHIEKAVTRLLKGGALIALSGTIAGEMIQSFTKFGMFSAIVFSVFALIACIFMIVAAGPMILFAVAAFDPSDNMEKWGRVVRDLVGIVFALVFVAMIVGLFFLNDATPALAL